MRSPLPAPGSGTFPLSQVDRRVRAGQPPSPAILAGEYALRVLGIPGFAGQVLAACSDAFYILGSSGQVVWVAQPSSVLHRRAILARFEPRAVREHARVEVSGGRLILAGIPPILLSEARRWIAEPIKRSHITPIENLSHSIRDQMAWIADLPDRRGLGHAAGLVLGSGSHLPLDGMDPCDQVLWKAARAPVEDVLRASRDGELADAVRAGISLLGLGPGLTPSGDDFMGALLFVARQLSVAYPDRLANGQEATQDFLASSRSATNQISRTLLKDLVHGHGPKPLHDLVSAILLGGSRSRIESSARRLTQIGHSSGWDMLAGVLTGLMLLQKQDEM